MRQCRRAKLNVNDIRVEAQRRSSTIVQTWIEANGSCYV
jgi:hypothetical protein